MLKSEKKETEDLSGRDRIIWNVISGWASYVVLIVSGFVMPRLLDRHMGQTALGLWDFCWSFISYFNLLEIGVGSSVNRHVALYRAVSDTEGVARLTSSVLAVQLAVASLVGVATIFAVWVFPDFLSEQSSAEIISSQWMVMFLGIDLAVRIAGNPFRGVITGCHRWGVHNGIIAVNEIGNVSGMVAVVMFGGGLRELGMVVFLMAVLTETIRAIAAFRVCSGLRVGIAYVEWTMARRMMSFGGKAAVERISRLVLNATNNFFIVSFLGPAALAVYARPNAILRHVETIVNKFAFVLSPTVGFLQKSGRQAELREFVLRSAYYGTCLTLPMTLMLALLGGQILTLWMGPRYNVETVVVILAMGSFLSIFQRPIITILIGANLHGKAAIVSLLAAFLGISASLLALGPLQLGLPGAALGVASAFVANAIFLIIYTCRKFAIPFEEYARRVLLEPIFYVLPFAICLTFCRIQFNDRPFLAVSLGCVFAVLTLGPLYWKYVIPNRMKDETWKVFLRTPGFGAFLAR